jgi:indole-3-glycerol phosphate synthase
VLDELFAGAVADSAAREEQISALELESQISGLGPTIDVIAALSPASKIRVIAEIKRRSPSRGEMAPITDVSALAKTYQESGAAAISVLTERHGFSGSPADLRAARQAVEIPLLRKDFIANEYQLLEARAWGADFALLIATWLTPARFAELYRFATDIGLGVLAETHSEADIDSAVAAGSRIIGINTRDLQTFKTDIDLFAKLAGLLPADAIKVAESSVKDVADVRAYRAAGADCVLVGEALVTGDARALLEQFTSVQA